MARASSKTKKPTEEAAVNTEGVVSEAEVETVRETKNTRKNYRAKNIDPSTTVVVRNGFPGRLVFVVPKTGNTYVWEEFGNEQDIEIGELKSARNSEKSFFINNWFLFDEDWVVDYLNVKNYYVNALDMDSFDDLYNKTSEEIESILSKMSDGQKQSVSYRARQLIQDGVIDSNRVISTLERCLDVELVER